MNPTFRSTFGAIACALLLCLLVFAIALRPALSASAQSQAAGPSQAEPSAVVKVTTRLIVVDVVATDGRGNPITDLQPGDFALMEDGKEQKIRSFTFVHPDPAAPRVIPISATESEIPGLVDNHLRYKANGALNVLLLDAMNTQTQDQKYARDQMIKFLNKIPTDRPIAVFALGRNLTLLQDFTTDPALLRAAVNTLTGTASAHLEKPTAGPEMPDISPWGLEALAYYAPQVQQSLKAFREERITDATDIQVNITLSALKSIARALGGYPGRKNLIWLSGGFPAALVPDSSIDFNRSSGHERSYYLEIERVAKQLSDAQISVYPVDARSLINNSVYSSMSNTASTGEYMGRTARDPGAMSREMAITSDELLAAHSTMNKMAEETGGRAFYDRNDLDVAIKQGLDDGSTYYSISYTPENKDWNGRYRKIAVRSNRQGLKLRYRAGYFALDPEKYQLLDVKARAQEFGQAMSFDFPISTVLPFQAQVTPPGAAAPLLQRLIEAQMMPASAAGPNKSLIRFAVDAHALSFQEKNGNQLAQVDCAVQAYNAKGKSVKTESNSVTADLPPESYKKVMENWLPCTVVVDLPPGEYYLRLGVRDARSGLVGTTNAKLNTLATSASAATEGEKKQ